MFKLVSHFMLVLLLVFPTITLLHNKGLVSAEEDAVEDEVVTEEDEGEVETEEDEGIVEDEDEGGDSASAPSATEEEEPEVITAHKDAETAVIFTSGTEPSVIAGKKSSAFIHFANKASSNLIITSIEGSFRYPQDHAYVIQNFTVITPNKMVDAGYEGSFQYDFRPGDMSGGRSFGLIINVNYKDTEDNMYRDAVFNQTIQVSENEEGMDAETFFMYLMILAMGALGLLAIFHSFGGKTRRGRKRAVPIGNGAPGSSMETGTSNGPVDYAWIPEHTIKAMNKGTPSPRRSPRKRAGKKASAAEK